MKIFPKISVILSVYNGERFIKEAVGSILDQTFSDFEFIIVDDGSTDGTAEVLDAFSDPRIVRLKNEKNISLVKSLNRGLGVARGELIARMDADDISYPQRFERQVRFLEENPEVGVLGTHVKHVDARSKFISVLEPPATHELIYWKMLFSCAIVHPSVMMRRDLVNRAGGYNPSFIHVEDTELWSRLVGLTRFANLQEVLHVRRLHGRSIMSTQSDVQYRSGTVIRKRLFSGVLNREVPDHIAEWFSRTETPLKHNQVRETTSLLVELFSKFVQNKTLDVETETEIRRDLVSRVLLVSQSNRSMLVKKMVVYLRRIIPAPLRHKIRSSAIGGRFNRYLKPL